MDGVIRKMLLLVALFILLSFQAEAATISGTVYDLSLEPIDALVSINTVPNQFFVALGGNYKFNVNPGTYVLRANTTEGKAIEVIKIVDDGNYTIDMIIELDIEEPPEFIDETGIEYSDLGLNGVEKSSIYSWIIPLIIGIIIVLLAIVIVLLLISKNTGKKTENSEKKANYDAEQNITDIELKTIALIREHSRITQKELRKMMPYSEAKISLVVAQLESEGKIKKIKKGRGNILVYVKG